MMRIRRCGLKKMEDFSINILSNNVKIKRLSLIDPTSCRDDLVSTAIVLFSNNSKYVFNVTSLMTVITYCDIRRGKDLHTVKKSVKGPVFPEVGLTKYR